MINVQRDRDLGRSPLVCQPSDFEHSRSARGQHINGVPDHDTLAGLGGLIVDLDVPSRARFRGHRARLEHPGGPQPLVDSNFFHPHPSCQASAG